MAFHRNSLVFFREITLVSILRVVSNLDGILFISLMHVVGVSPFWFGYHYACERKIGRVIGRVCRGGSRTFVHEFVRLFVPLDSIVAFDSN